MSQAQREPRVGMRPDLIEDKKTDMEDKKELKPPKDEWKYGLPARCLMLADEHYVISGSIGITAKFQTPKKFLLDTGSRYNVIRANSLPPGWQKYIKSSDNLP